MLADAEGRLGPVPELVKVRQESLVDDLPVHSLSHVEQYSGYRHKADQVSPLGRIAVHLRAPIPSGL
jgi:hypothetical protein